MNSPLLDLQEITFSYGYKNNIVLDSFSMEIESGTITAVLGPNGAGKTTLLHLLLGWLKPGVGNILLDNHALQSYTRRELSQWMALVPQSENIPYEYSVLEFVLFGRTPYLNPLEMPSEKDFSEASKALNMVGLAGFQDRLITRLSGGERQLILIARALTQKPRILLLDEPTAHLDLGNKNRVINLLKQLNQHGVTILLTTHEPDIASNIATHLILLNRGQVLQAGLFEKVFTSENLSSAYEIDVRVFSLDGHRVVLWN